jgi:hypothetical protein
MSTSRDLDLLEDLIGLLRKYGADTFQSLAHSLKPDAIPEVLSNLLEELAEAEQVRYSRRRGGAATQSARATRGVLTSIKESEPEKYKLLSKFREDLLDGRLLPTMRDLRAFAVEVGLPELSQSSRQKAVAPVIRSLMSLPLDDVRAIIQAIATYDSHDRDLEGWSNIILDKRPESENHR